MGRTACAEACLKALLCSCKGLPLWCLCEEVEDVEPQETAKALGWSPPAAFPGSGTKAQGLDFTVAGFGDLELQPKAKTSRAPA